MKITLTSPNGKTIKKNTGFSVRFLIFGSFNYLFTGRWIKFILAWIWNALTLIWLIQFPKFLEQFLKIIITEPVKFIAITLKQPKFALNYIDFWVEAYEPVFKFKTGDFSYYEFSRILLIGLGLFLAVRLLRACFYNKSEIKRLKKKKGYTVYEERITAAQERIDSTSFSYERPQAQTDAAIRSMQSKRAVELHMLNEAYAAGLISYDVYKAKRAILEEN